MSYDLDSLSFGKYEQASHELEWLLSGKGASVFERSPLGEQLYQMQLFAARSRRCKAEGCKKGIIKSGPREGEWCEKCQGTGFLDVCTPRSDEPLMHINPTRSSFRMDAYDNDWMVIAAAQASRALRDVEHENTLASQALELYHGPRGLRVASDKGNITGAILCVVPLTKSGAVLVEDERVKGRNGRPEELAVLAWRRTAKGDAGTELDNRRSIALTAAKELVVAGWDTYSTVRGFK